MLHTFFIPLIVGLVCFLVAAGVLQVVMPMLPIDDGVKGAIKLVFWAVAFALPAEILRKKAKQKQAADQEQYSC